MGSKKAHLADQERLGAKRRAAWESLIPTPQREIRRLMPQVRASKKAHADRVAAQKADLAAMTPAQLAAHYAKPAVDIPERAPERPDFWTLAVEAVQAEERNERERELGLPQERANWERARDEIAEKLRQVQEEARTTEGDARAKCEEVRAKCDELLTAAKERERTELDDLGPRPALSDHEVKV